jgi:spore coat polysaccharide biosynthesis protein SpsF
MMQAAGRPLLAHVVERVKACAQIDTVIVITTRHPEDRAILEWCAAHGVPCVRWTLTLSDGCNDVLARFARAAQRYPADHYVRITGDCALWSPLLGGEVITEHLRGSLEYTSNVHPLMDGFDTEIFTQQLLMDTARLATSNYDRQHVTPWMRLNAICGYVDHIGYSQCYYGKPCDLSVNTDEDFTRVRRILERVRDFSHRETLRVAKEVESHV